MKKIILLIAMFIFGLNVVAQENRFVPLIDSLMSTGIDTALYNSGDIIVPNDYIFKIAKYKETFLHADEVEFSFYSTEPDTIKADNIYLVTLSMLLRYKKECYNYNTRIPISVYVELNLPNLNIIRRDGDFLILNKKPTFEDFLNWIENK